MTFASRRIAPLLIALPLVLAACGGGGGGNSDEDQLRAIINDGAKDPTTICDNASADVLKALGGKDACVKTAKQQPSDGKADIKSVTVNGDKATAKITDKSGDQTISFVKENGDWKVAATN